MNRPGTDFADLPAAVAAAAPGDVLRVRNVDPALRLFYSLPTIRRGICIVGETPRPICMDILHVLGLPAGETVLVSNLRLGTVETTLLTNPPARGVVLQGNRGGVFFDDVEYGTHIAPGSTAGVLVDNCALMTFAHCVLYQCVGYIHFVDSSVVATNTAFIPYADNNNFIIGTPLWCERARVWLVDSEVRGGDRQPPYIFEASAVAACNSYFWLAGSTVVLPGWPYFSAGSFVFGATFHPWPASCNPGYSEVRMSPGVQVMNLVPGLLVITSPQPAITWSTSQSQLSLRTYGHPSSATILAAAIDPVPQPSNPLGHLFLAPTASIVLAIAITNSQGQHTLNYAVPPGLPPDMRMTVQGVQLTPSANLEVTNVTVVSTW